MHSEREQQKVKHTEGDSCVWMDTSAGRGNVIVSALCGLNVSTVKRKKKCNVSTKQAEKKNIRGHIRWCNSWWNHITFRALVWYLTAFLVCSWATDTWSTDLDTFCSMLLTMSPWKKKRKKNKTPQQSDRRTFNKQKADYNDFRVIILSKPPTCEAFCSHCHSHRVSAGFRQNKNHTTQKQDLGPYLN